MPRRGWSAEQRALFALLEQNERNLLDIAISLAATEHGAYPTTVEILDALELIAGHARDALRAGCHDDLRESIARRLQTTGTPFRT